MDVFVEEVGKKKLKTPNRLHVLIVQEFQRRLEP